MTLEQQIEILNSWPMIIALSIIAWIYLILAFTHPKCTIIDKITAIITWFVILGLIII